MKLIEPRGHARGSWKPASALWASARSVLRSRQRRHLVRSRRLSAFIPVQARGLLRRRIKILPLILSAHLGILCFSGCTVKAVGDPNRPITINANVVVDIRGLKQTASNIEDLVSKGGKV